jgi:hypothetical protein
MGTDWQLQNPFLNSADADRISVEGLRRTQCEQMSSELPLKADIAQYSRHVSKGPIVLKNSAVEAERLR